MMRIMPGIPEIAAEASFGMALAAAGVPAEKLGDCLFLSDSFSAVELPVELLERKEASYLLARALRGCRMVQIGSIIDGNVARNALHV